MLRATSVIWKLELGTWNSELGKNSFFRWFLTQFQLKTQNNNTNNNGDNNNNNKTDIVKRKTTKASTNLLPFTLTFDALALEIAFALWFILVSVSV